MVDAIIATKEASAIGKIDSRSCVFIAAGREHSGFAAFIGQLSVALPVVDFVVKQSAEGVLGLLTVRLRLLNEKVNAIFPFGYRP